MRGAQRRQKNIAYGRTGPAGDGGSVGFHFVNAKSLREEPVIFRRVHEHCPRDMVHAQAVTPCDMHHPMWLAMHPTGCPALTDYAGRDE
jgi:hypothetical protein